MRTKPVSASSEIPIVSAGLEAGQAWLVYDGACPFCSSYVRYLRLRDSLGQPQLINARSGGPIVEHVRSAGLDLNGGFVLWIGDSLYSGSDCIHVLALLSSRSTTFNRVNAAIFKSRRMSRMIYPLLRATRNLTLRLMRRRAIGG
jgi:predicted DCC family thiol-disulfide oxidoreductase YuxK